MASGKLDLHKLYKDEYVAPRKPQLVEIGTGTYLTIAGRGAPGGELFSRKLQALYAVAYAIKMGAASPAVRIMP